MEDEVQGEVTDVTPEQIAPEVIERAKMMGHIPKEEFRGDPERWVPADKYVERAENLMPILKSQLGKYETEISSLKATVESQKKTTENLVKMSEKTQQIAYEQAKKELTTRQVKAVADGDSEAFERLENEKNSLPAPEPVKIEEPVASPVFDQWKSGNEWYLKDQSMTDYANFYGQQLQSQNPSMQYNELLSKVEDKIKETFPSKFENPARSNPTVVDSTSTREVATKTGGKTYNDLTAEEKEVCQRNVEQKLYKSKEDWVKVYFEEEE